MTINYTTLLGLAQPVTGTETGQWGDVVNDEITSLLEDAVANAASISVTSGNVTLTTTNGASNQARMSTLIITGSPGTTRNVIAPSQAKVYVVINQSDGEVVIKGAATTGVTVGAGQTAQIAWNGSDFVEVGNYVHGNFVVNGNLTVNGNSTLGDAGADTTTINGQFIAANSAISKATTLTTSVPALTWIKGQTYTDTGTAGGTTQAHAPFNLISAPTLSTSNIVTYTNASTLYIAGAPTAGGSATITNPYALYSAAGANYFGGNSTFAANVTLGDAAADNITVNGTITSNLIFTDNTYDIGASGATRPRTAYIATSLRLGANSVANSQASFYGNTTSTYTQGLVHIYSTSSSTTGPENGLIIHADGPSAGYYSNSIEFDVGGGGGRARMYTLRGSAPGGQFNIDTQDTSGSYYNRYYVDAAGGHYWKNVDLSTGATGMSITANGLYVLNSLGLGTSATSGYKINAQVSDQVGLLVGGNTSSHQKQDIYITRPSAGSTIQSGPNLTISNTSTNGSYALQVMDDSSLALWSYLRGSWAQVSYWTGYGLVLNGASSSNGTMPLYISATSSDGVAIGIDGGGINVKPSLIQFQQQNNGYWRFGMPQNANRMAIYGYASATYPELFTFLEGSAGKGTLGIGMGASTSGAYSIHIDANTSLAINASRSGGTGIRLDDTVTNSWDMINQSNQLQFVRGGTLGWYFNSGRTFVRTATADDTFLSIQSSYSGNPEIIRLAQSSSDGYMLIKSAGGDTTQLAAYSGTLTYFAKSKVAVGSTSTNGARLYSLAASTEAALHTATGPTANTSVWTITGSGGTNDGVKWADVDIGGQGNGGSYFEWVRGGSYDNWLNLYMRQGGSSSSANRFQFYNDGQAYKSSGAGTWGALSDIRIKTNVETVTGGLGRIMQLRPVTFDYKSPSAHNDKVHDKGFIADDYMLVYPNSVRECEFIHDDDKQHLNGGKPKALSFEAEFYADLVDAIQTLKKEFDAYKASHP